MPIHPVKGPAAVKLLVCCIISSAALLGADFGDPIIRNYQPRQLGISRQVWSILQDRRGVMLFGDSGGVSEFDGETWHKIPVPSSTTRSLAEDATGRIWVGLNEGFGYLDRNARGQYEYVSLLDQVPAANRQLTTVWQVLPMRQGVFFRTYEALFRWDGKRMKVWTGKGRFEGLSEVRGRVYISEGGVGLREIVGDELVTVPGGEAFRSAAKVFLHPYGEKEMLVSSREAKLAIFDGQRARPFVTEADSYLEENTVYVSALLPNGHLCITTLRGGAVVIDAQGRQLHRIERGLVSKGVLSAGMDREGALWLGLGEGIARVDIQSPIRRFGDAGPNGSITHQGTVYAAFASGGSALQRVRRDPVTGVTRLENVPTKANQAWNFVSFDGQLLASTALGVQIVRERGAEALIPGLEGPRESTNGVIRSRVNPQRVFVLHQNGLSSIRWDGRTWINEGRAPAIRALVGGVAEDDQGRVWVGSGESVYRFEITPKGLGDAPVTRFGPEHGLHPPGLRFVQGIAGEIFTYSYLKKGIQRFDAPSQRFVKDSRFDLPLAEGDWFNAIFRLQTGELWSVSRSLTEQRQGWFRRKPDGAFELVEDPFRRLSAYNLWAPRIDSDGAFWFGGDSFIRFDPKIANAPLPPITALVRRVTSGAGDLVYGGVGEALPSLPADRNSLLFEFAANVFGGENETSYRYRLDGADQDWSPWVRQHEARYSGLGPGQYRFRVQARAIDGRESREGSLPFSIIPPWYRAPWAYAGYALSVLGLLVGGRKLIIDRERARAREQTAALEATVAERTREIASQRDSINLLNEIGKEITASLDLDTILFKLYERVNQITDASIFGVGLYKPAQNQIEYTLAIENGKRYAPYTRSTLDKNQLPVWCIDHRMPVLINDVATEATRYIGQYEHKSRLLEDGSPAQAPVSMIYLPLVAQDRVLGVLSVQSFKKNAYGERDLSLLENLAAYTTIALDNASAYKQVNEREHEVATVNRITQAISAQLDQKALLELVGEQVRDVFRAPIAYVALLDRASMMLHFPFTYGEDSPSRPFGQGLTSRIIRTGEPLLINEDLDGTRQRLGIEQLGRRAASFLGVPIPCGDEIVGVISVQSTDLENRFTEADQKLLTTIASAVGVALHNARLFEETRLAKAAAEEADAAKSSFLSTVSHELRTPLTSVLGFAKIIRRRLEDRLFPLIPEQDRKVAQAKSQVVENLGVVVSEGERLTKLIDDVLDLAKIEAGKFTWNMERIAIGDVIERAFAATASLFEAKKLQAIREVAPDLPMLQGDRDRLIQVVINLISNAVKFTDEGSVRCTVSLRPDGQLQVAVTDSGIGIAPADQPKVFEKFKQVGDTLTDKPKGTGLGLPICKEIVEHHGGRIWVESTPGAGSTFAFTLPCESMETRPSPLDIESLVRRLRETVATQPPRSRSILVVDDDPHIRELLHQEFTDAGYTVRLAEDGRRALHLVREEKPGLIVLDVMMPEMNGFDVAAVLKNDPVTMDIPIIILSIVEDKERGFRLGVDRYLTKPIDTPLLFQQVDALLGQGKSRRKVMVVDEDQSTLRTITDVLEARGYQVVESNGAELVTNAVSNKPDIIILSSLLSSNHEAVRTLRFEKGLEDVLFLLYR